VLTVILALPQPKYPTPADSKRFADPLMGRVRALPGVGSGIGDRLRLPMTGGSTQPLSIEGEPVKPMAEQPEVAVRRLMPGIFARPASVLIAGRDFTDAGHRGLAACGARQRIDGQAVLAESESNRQTTDADVPPRRCARGGRRRGRRQDLRARCPGTVACALRAVCAEPVRAASRLSCAAACRRRPLTASIAAALHEIDPDLPMLNVRTMDEVVNASIAQRQFAMELLGAFAHSRCCSRRSASTASCPGPFVSACARSASGARLVHPRWTCSAWSSFEGLKPTFVGVALGVVSALALGRLMSALVFGITPHDAVTLSAVATIIALVGATATLLPAYRATRVDPVVALRDEP
jgi:hypothetical protein